MQVKLRTKIMGGFLCLFIVAAILGVYSFTTVNQMYCMQAELYAMMQAGQSIDAQVQMIANYASDSLWMIGVISVIGVIVFVVLSFVISKSILTSIRRLAVLVNDVSHGRLTYNKQTHLADDELGHLTADIYDLADAIKNIVNDLGGIHHEFNEVGNMNHRLDTSKYHDSFQVMVEGVNSLLDQHVDDVKSILHVLEEINDGNFDVKIEELPGDWIIIAKDLRAVVQHLEEINKAVSYLSTNASDGHLDVAIDTNKFKGSWRSMVTTLNKLVESIEIPLSEMEHNIVLMSEGDFSPMKGEYSGHFKKIQDACNLTNTITHGLVEDISRVLSAMADGDLTVPIYQDYVGSYMPIKESLNQILDSLNKSLSGINNASEQVLSGAEQLSVAAGLLADGAMRQNDSLDELSTSMRSINEKANESAANAAIAQERAEDSTAFAKEGEEKVQSMLMSMDHLKESSAGISKIMKVISDIAFQTNLLALNAAVEAARAGEHGRGFSVVAEEVRSLAGKSQESTGETSVIIAEDVENVEKGIVAATDVAHAFTTIMKDITQISEMIMQIVDISKEQAQSISEVNVSVNDIAQVVQSNSAASEESAAFSEELSTQAEALQDLVSFFKLR